MNLNTIPEAPSKHAPAQELSVIPPGQEPNLDTMARADVPAIFSDFSEQAKPLLEKADQLTITPENALVVADVAAKCRKEIKAVRTACERRRKELVEGIKRQAKQIDTAAGVVWDVCEAAEAKLLAIEQHAEQEWERQLDEMVAFRSAAVKSAEGNPSHYNLREMEEEAFVEMIGNLAAGQAFRKEAAIKAKLEQESREKKEAEAREAQRLENERLKAEAAERERAILTEQQAAKERERAAAEAARKEREEIEAKAKAEREKLEAAAKAERDAATKRQKILEEEAARERRDANAERERADAAAKAEREAAAARQRAIEEKAEQERQQAAERARIAKAENDAKLKALADAAEKQRLADESGREEMERRIAQRDLKELREREAKEEAERIAAAAPDREKLVAYAHALRSVLMPAMSTPEGESLAKEIALKTHGFSEQIEKRAGELSKSKKGQPKGSKEGELL